MACVAIFENWAVKMRLSKVQLEKKNIAFQLDHYKTWELH